jgi:hypothetical protein
VLLCLLAQELLHLLYISSLTKYFVTSSPTFQKAIYGVGFRGDDLRNQIVTFVICFVTASRVFCFSLSACEQREEEDVVSTQARRDPG